MRPVEVLNKKCVLTRGVEKLRADAIDIIEAAIRSADPYLATKRSVFLEGDILHIDSVQYDLRQRDHIYFLGAGKATQGIALALEEILGERITDGVAVLKHGDHSQLKRMRVIYAGHPVPDENSLAGGRELMRMAEQAGERDLVITAITGGSSALVILPPTGVSLADVRLLNQVLLDSGASIFEINAVRKHASQIKGGRLALQVFPAELVSLTVSDVVGDALDYITDLTVPDTSFYTDAWNTLDKYRLWNKLPYSIHHHLKKGPETESPKTFHSHCQTILLVAGNAAFQGAIQRSQELGYITQALVEEIDGESYTEALNLVNLAVKSYHQNSICLPHAWLASGETIVTLNGQRGEGGPNQEFALSAALKIANLAGIVVASVDVDGTDGPTDAAGAVVDGETVMRAVEAGFEPQEYLGRHASHELLLASHDLIYTGPTGTNVNDIMFVLIDKLQ